MYIYICIYVHHYYDTHLKHMFFLQQTSKGCMKNPKQHTYSELEMYPEKSCDVKKQ